MEPVTGETRAPWADPLVLAGLTLLVYGRALGHGFLLNWDDLTYVLENPAIQALDLEHLRLMFSGPYFGNYAPLHLLSYAVDHALWGFAPAGFVAVNLALHAANAWLLERLLVRLGLRRLPALLAALLFLVHPVQVESVAWISERKNLLSMTFSLAGLHAFLLYRGRDGAGRWAAYAASVAAVSAALLAKAAAVVIPPLLLLLDLCVVPPARRRHLLADKVPFALAAAAVALATTSSQESMIAEGRAEFAMDGPTTLYTMAPIVLRYLGMVVWPAGLSALYTPPIRTAPDAAVAVAATGFVALAALGVLLWRRARPLLAPYAFFFVALVPVLHLVPLPTLMNDRYLYFPLLGVAALAGVGLDRLQRGAHGWRVALAASAAGLLALSAAAFVRTGVWRDDVTLWADVTEKAPGSSLAWVGLATSLADLGRPGEAIPAFQRALALAPEHPLALNGIGAAYNTLGEFAAARPFLLRAAELAEDPFSAWMNLGVGFLATGERPAAEQAFQAALARRPGSPAALEALARLRGSGP